MRMLIRVAWLILLVGQSTWSGFATAANTLQQLSSRHDGGSVLLMIKMQHPIGAFPNTWSASEPRQVVFDFPDTSNATGTSLQHIAKGVLDDMNLVQVDSMTRLVLNLSEPIIYSAEIDGRTLYIKLSRALSSGNVASTFLGFGTNLTLPMTTIPSACQVGSDQELGSADRSVDHSESQRNSVYFKPDLRVSIYFQNADATIALRSLGEISGKRVRVDPLLAKKLVTVNVANLSYKDALVIVTCKVNAAYRFVDGFIHFVDRDEERRLNAIKRKLEEEDRLLVKSSREQNKPKAASESIDIGSLLAGCLAIPDAKKKAKCFEVAASLTTSVTAPAQKLDSIKSPDELERETNKALREKFAGVTRAFIAIRAATEVGVSLDKYGDLVRSIATEISVAKTSDLSWDEQQAIFHYEQALDSYSDAKIFWLAHVNWFADSKNRRGNESEILPTYAGMDLNGYGSKYNLQIIDRGMFSVTGVTKSDGLNAAWRRANEYVKLAEGVLFRKKSNVQTGEEQRLIH